MAAFLISDTHFGHGNILRFCRRPHLTPDEMARVDKGDQFRVSEESIRRMDEEILANINKVVGKTDVLYHLGDFAWRSHGEYRERIDCDNVILILGNHDSMRDVKGLFSEIHEELMVTLDGQKIRLKHYPLFSWEHSYKGVWHAFGHVHGRLGHDPDFRKVYERLRSIDVGVDGPWADRDGPMASHRFAPWSMAEVREFMSLKHSAPHI